MIKSIIWDFDGTLFDTYPAMVQAFKKGLKDSGVEAEEAEILKYMKISVTEAINHFKEKHNLNDDFIQRYVNYEHNLQPSDIMPFYCAKEICSEFQKREGRNFLLTHRGDSTFNILKYHGMSEYFQEVVTRKNCFKRKPDPEGFMYLIEKYNLNCEEVLVVGDRECDILGGKNSKAKTCLFNTNNIEFNFDTDFKISSLFDLANLLGLDNLLKEKEWVGANK